MSPAEELRYLILAAQREGNRDLARALRPLGLTPAQAEVLVVLAAHAPLSVRALGTRLVCEGGSPSRLVAALVGAGQVERRSSPDDARLTVLRLTAAGRTAVAEVRRIEAGLHAAIETAGSEAELADAVAMLRRLVVDRPAGRAVQLRRATNAGTASGRLDHAPRSASRKARASRPRPS